MSEMSEHDQIENSVAAYLVGASEPGEADLVRAHLEECASCRVLASRLRRAVFALPVGVEESPPPERLRARILEAAASGRPDAGRADLRTPHLTSARRAGGGRARVGTPHLTSPPWAGGGRAAVAALAIAVIALGAWDGYLTSRLQQSEADRTTIHGQGSMAGSQAEVIRLRREGVTLVDFKEMRQLDSNSVYVLWLIRADGHPVNAAAFRPDPDGGKLIVLSQDLSGYSQIGVTVEVSPDVKEPSQAPQLGGKLG